MDRNPEADTRRTEVAMIQLSSSYRVAAVYRQERMSEAALWHRASQAVQPEVSRRISLPALSAPVRYARYLVGSLAAVAFGFSVN
jgi:hypothetical protein